MEIIKSVIKQFYPLLIMMASVAFVVYTLFSADINNGQGIFEAGGELYTSMMGTGEIKNESLSYIDGASIEEVPEVTYASGVQRTGTDVIFKGLLSVKKTNGTIVNGTVEDEFTIYLLDIRTPEGESMLETLPTHEIENLEEIPAPFIYDKETDRLYIYSAGVYLVRFKIYGSNGGQATYEFQLPVEIT